MDSTVYLLEDDYFFAATFKEELEDIGIRCEIFPSVAAFEKAFPGPSPKYLIVDLAAPLADTKLITMAESRAGHQTGIALIRKVRQEWKDCTFLLMTGGPSADAQQWCEQNNIQYVLKPIDRQKIEQMFGLRDLRAFVVHGRDMAALEKTKAVLSGISIEPIVLFERPNKGQTVIEKFEQESGKCDCAVVILTPDDFGGLAGNDPVKVADRVRQNVIFELGYFCGYFGRRSGRVILVEFGTFEIPSDLAGVIRLAGEKEVDALSKEIGAEFDHLQ